MKVKNEALKEFEKGMPSKGVAKQFSIPGSTFATWKKNKENIFEAFQIHHWNDKEWKLEHTKS